MQSIRKKKLLELKTDIFIDTRNNDTFFKQDFYTYWNLNLILLLIKFLFRSILYL